jgi:hypothetical protein
MWNQTNNWTPTSDMIFPDSQVEGPLYLVHSVQSVVHPITEAQLKARWKKEFEREYERKKRHETFLAVVKERREFVERLGRESRRAGLRGLFGF